MRFDPDLSRPGSLFSLAHPQWQHYKPRVQLLFSVLAYHLLA